MQFEFETAIVRVIGDIGLLKVLGNFLEFVGVDSRMRVSLSLMIFELIVACVLFQLSAWITLGLTPQNVIWPMLCCSVLVSAAGLFCGIYDKRSLNSLPNMHARGYLGFALSAVLCISLTSLAFPSVHDARFTFSFIFANVIVLTTARSLFCAWATTDSTGDHRSRRSMDKQLES